MNKKIFIGIIIFLILFLQINYVFAVGISPAKRTIDYQPGKIEKFSYGIYNNEKFESTIKIEVTGGKLRDSIVFSETEINFSQGELMRQIEGAISFPNSEIEQDEVIDIVAKETPKKGAFVNIQLEVKSRIDIRAPPRKIVELKEEKKEDKKEIITQEQIRSPTNKTVTKIEEEKLNENDLIYILLGALTVLIILQIYLAIYQYVLAKNKNLGKKEQNKKIKRQKTKERKWKKNKKRN